MSSAGSSTTINHRDEGTRAMNGDKDSVEKWCNCHDVEKGREANDLL